MRRSSVTSLALVAGLLVGAGACDVRVERSEASGSDAQAASADASAADAAPEVPDRPASGTINGRSFTYEDASIDEGILELRQGEDFFADLEVTLFLFLDDKTQVPEGRTWDVDCEGTFQSGAPHVHISWRQGDESNPEMDSIVCGYRLYLELGEETPETTLPGRILLEAPALDTEIAGRFEATIEGFRTVDGQVDLTQDDLDVAHHLAAEWLAERHGGPVEVADHSLAWLHTEQPEGRTQAGYAVYWWQPEGGGDTSVAKLQFAKRDGAWQVDGELEPWQVAKAHPVSPRTDLGGALEHRAAARFEEEHVAMNGKRPVFVVQTRSSYNPTVGMAEVKVHYTLDPEVARESGGFFGNDTEGPLARYLFRTDAEYPAYKEPGAWTLERRLQPGETVDYKAGRVVTE